MSYVQTSDRKDHHRENCCPSHISVEKVRDRFIHDLIRTKDYGVDLLRNTKFASANYSTDRIQRPLDTKLTRPFGNNNRFGISEIEEEMRHFMTDVSAVKRMPKAESRELDSKKLNISSMPRPAPHPQAQDPCHNNE